MKERVVFLFLVAMGTIKVYEDFGDEDDMEDADKDIYFTSKNKFKNVGKRSVDNIVARWKMADFNEELIEASNGIGSKGLVECSDVPDIECSCRRLTCFAEVFCERNISSPLSAPPVAQPTPQNPSIPPRRDQFVQCRQTSLFGEILCECKKYTRRSLLQKFRRKSRLIDRRLNSNLDVGSKRDSMITKKRAVAPVEPKVSGMKRKMLLNKSVGERFDPKRLLKRSIAET